VLLFLALGITFPVLGYKVRSRLSNVPIIHDSRRAKVAEVTSVTWILTLVFVVRSVLVLVLPNTLGRMSWTESTMQQYFTVYCFMVTVYFVVFEAFPAGTVLWNQRRMPPALGANFDSVGDLAVNGLHDELIPADDDA
jgi:hypothetical protein